MRITIDGYVWMDSLRWIVRAFDEETGTWVHVAEGHGPDPDLETAEDYADWTAQQVADTLGRWQEFVGWQVRRRQAGQLPAT